LTGKITPGKVVQLHPRLFAPIRGVVGTLPLTVAVQTVP